MSATSDRQDLIKLFQRYNQRLGILYGKFIKELSKLGVSVEDKLQDEPLFLFDHFPELKTRLSEIIKEYKADYVNLYKQGISSGVALAFGQDAKNLHGYTIYNDDAINRVRTAAINAFTKQRMSPPFGLSLSQKIWNYLQQTKSEFEVAVSNVITDGLKKGTSAAELSRQVRQQLVNPDMMYRRYHHKVITAGGTKKDVVKWHKRIIDGDGKVRFVEAPLEQVGRGVYRSSYKNSFRLMRTEINMSYHYANNERWKAEPFVIGMRISLSPEHPREDMCDELAGDYPKDFNWASWHPQCYSDDSEVYTSRGWLLFKDVRIEDKILSLNPSTKNVEWTDIVRLIAYQREGKMVRFHNRSLDMLVTPDHRMVYLSKSTGEIQYKEADKFGCTNILYRSCVYDNNHHDSIEINNTQFDFKTFCEFMGYWLSDGNVSRSTTIFVAQQKGDPNRANIISCIERLGLTPRPAKTGIYVFSRPLRDYLAQFGKSYEKYVPQVIKDANKEEIRCFLNAYVTCDGSTRTPHSFIGSHGNVCNPKHEERVYYTTSKRMADDIGECILKVGCRPSFFLDEHKGQKHQFKNGIYTLNFDCWRICELKSQTATQFKKEYIDYNGVVYDLELAENHIMYIRRNGKCVWGSNCLCMSSAILCSKEELKEISKRAAKGEDLSVYKSPNLITECPENFNRYIDSQHDKIIAAAERGTLGYYLRDNKKYWAGRFSATERQQMGISEVSPTNKAKEVAKMRHAKRTPEQVADIQSRWDRRKIENIFDVYIKASDYNRNIEVPKFVSRANHAIYEGKARSEYITDLREAEKWAVTINKANIRHEARTDAHREAIQKRWDARSLYSVNMPGELRVGAQYLKGENYVFDKNFFNLIDKSKPIRLEITRIDGGSYSSWEGDLVHLVDGSRNSASSWHKKSVVYHEYGHCIDAQRNLWQDATLLKLRKRHIKWLSKPCDKQIFVRYWDTTKGKWGGWAYKRETMTNNVAYIDQRLCNLIDKLKDMKSSVFSKYGISKEDIIEQITATRDTIKSLIVVYGDGHSSRYFMRERMSETEYLAHAFENTFIGNRVFQKVMPEIYDEMIAYIKYLKPLS